MQLRLDSLFGRLFGVLLLAIVLAHLLALCLVFPLRPAPTSRAAA